MWWFVWLPWEKRLAWAGSNYCFSWQNATLHDSLFIVAGLVCVLTVLYTALKKDSGEISLIGFLWETYVWAKIVLFGCRSNTICKLKEKHFAHIFLRHHGTWSSYSLCTYAIYCVHMQFIVHICNLLCTYAIYCVRMQFIVYISIYCVHMQFIVYISIYCVRMQFIVYVCNLLCMYAIYCVHMQFYYQKNQPNCLSKGVLLSHLMIFLLTTKSLWTSECADLHKSFLPQTNHKDHVLLQEVMVPQYTSWKV